MNILTLELIKNKRLLRASWTVYKAHFRVNRSFLQNVQPSIYRFNSTLSSLVNDSRLLKHLSVVNNEYEVQKNGGDEKNCRNRELFFRLKAQLDEHEKELAELQKMMSDSDVQNDKEFLKTAAQEKEECIKNIEQCKIAIISTLLPEEIGDRKDIIIEVSGAVGGQESMLFANELFEMYCRYAAYRGWPIQIMKHDQSDIGGVRNAHVGISGWDAYKLFKFEAGIHRVQRIPVTERAGRIHTSTVTVAVLPQPDEVDIQINMKDIEMEFKRSSGAGGQHVNKTDSCVRLKHIPTGIVAESQVERCQHRNREIAFKALKAKLFQIQLDKITKEQKQSRKSMVRNAARSDKIRTYNFPQDRVTDHRIHQNVFNITSFLIM